MHSNTPSRSRRFAAIAAIALLSSCGGDSTAPPTPVLTTMAVSLPSSTLQIGQTTNAIVVGSDQLGATIATGTVTWSSASTDIATVSSTGTVTAVAAGQATITATSGTIVGNATLTVIAVPVASVSVAPSSASIIVGATQQLTATTLDANTGTLTGRTVAWTTSNASVATVSSSGLVTAVAGGSATITATSEGKSGTSSITVTVPVATVTVSPSSASISVTGTQQITATTKDASGNTLSGRTVTWTTSDATIATVSSTGLVTGVAAGSATITATSETRTGTSTITVTSACANPLSLALGEIHPLTTAEKASVCVSGGASGSEYVLIPFNRSTVAASNVALHVTATNTSTIQFSPSLGTTGARRLGAVADLRAAGERAEIAFRERERRDIGDLRTRLAMRGARPPLRLTGVPATPTVGSTVQLNADITGNTCSDAKQPHNSTVVAVLPHTIVLVDQTAPANGYTNDELTAFGTAFDTLVYNLDVQNFSAPSDIDGNGRVAIFFTPTVNTISAQPGAVVLGLFSGRDLFTAAQCAASNEGEMFYMPVPDPASTLNGNYTNKTSLGGTVIATLGHEFQHLINAGRKIALSAPAFEEVWLNEGLSHVAEELVYYAESGQSPRTNIGLTQLQSSSAQVDAFNTFAIQNFSRLRTYMVAAESNSPYAANDNLETRGAIWQLLRYSMDRKGGTEATTWTSLVNTASSGQANFNAAFATGITQLTSDWATAQFTDDVGLTVPATATHPSWNFRSIWPGLGSSTFPLQTRALGSSALDITLGGGSPSYLRFRVNTGLQSLINTTSGGLAPSSSVDMTLVRTH